MKQIPLLLLENFKKSGKSTCYLVKVVDRDGIAYGFTTLDAIVTFNDGYHDVSYNPDEELRPQNIQSNLDMDVDTTELVGWFGQDMEALIVAGKFSFAEITIYRISYLRTSYGAEVIAFGTVGEVEYSTNSSGKRKIEFRSLTQQIKQHLNALYSLTCRAEFGDENCQMPFVWSGTATVDEVEDNFLRFKVTGIVAADDFYNLGVVEFLDGDNATAQLEVESWTADGWVTLSFVTPYAVPVGATLRFRQDCDKTHAACLSYGNVINMQAEHLTPTQDQSLMVPGAYIKSENAL